jgi:hypothetical protein
VKCLDPIGPRKAKICHNGPSIVIITAGRMYTVTSEQSMTRQSHAAGVFESEFLASFLRYTVLTAVQVHPVVSTRAQLASSYPFFIACVPTQAQRRSLSFSRGLSGVLYLAWCCPSIYTWWGPSMSPQVGCHYLLVKWSRKVNPFPMAFTLVKRCR